MRCTVEHLGFLLFGLLFCSFAVAEEPRDRARAHYESGLNLANEGRIAEAVPHFEAAYSLSPHFAVLFNLGRAYALLGQRARALETLSRYLRDGGGEVPLERRQEVEQQTEELRRQVAEIHLVVTPGGATIRLNGRTIGSAPLSDPVYLDPGTHVLELSRDGYVPQQQQLTVAAGDQRQLEVALADVGGPLGTLRIECPVIDVSWSIDGARPSRLPLPRSVQLGRGPHTVRFARDGYRADRHDIVVQEQSAALVRCVMNPNPNARRAPPQHAPRGADSTRPLRTWSYVALAGGVVLGGTTVGLFLWNNDRHAAWKKEDESLERIAQSGPPFPDDAQRRQSENEDLLQSIKSADVVAISTGVAAAGLGIAGAVLFGMEPEPQRHNARVRVVAGGGRIGITGSF